MELELQWRDRRVGPNQTPRRFLDYVVNGVSLYERHGMDFISCLGWLDPNQDEHAAQRLLGKAEPDLEARVAIYICPECGDLDCGAITSKIELEGGDVLWRGMAFSSIDWSEESWRHDQSGFDDLQELRFPVSNYEKAILSRPT
jgi:hypothetical protein